MRLFKYLHPDRTDVLKNAKIRYSSPSTLNDPFEVKPFLTGIAPNKELESGLNLYLPDYLIKEYEKLPRELRRKISLEKFKQAANNQMPKIHEYMYEAQQEILPVIQIKMEKVFDEMFGILCLTESPKNLLMWAHYADSHQGFVIEFHSDHPYFNRRLTSEDDFRCLKKVIYSQNRPNIDLSEIKNIEPFLTKGEEWSYETEWRIMDNLEKASEVIGEGVNAVHLFNFPKSIIKTVIFGCKMSETKKLEIKEILSSSIEYANVKCEQTQIDKSKYALTFS